jgi:hypothetical protein
VLLDGDEGARDPGAGEGLHTPAERHSFYATLANVALLARQA